VLEWVLGRLRGSKTFTTGVSDAKRGPIWWGKGGVDKPPVAPRTPSLRAVGIPRRVLSVGSQGGTAAPVVEFLDHDSFRLRRVEEEWDGQQGG
jgi:hypothetical protein